MNSNGTTFRASIALVLEETKSVKALRRSAHAKLLQFAIDTCLVAHGVRTGYLIDAIYPPDPEGTFAVLLKALHRKSSVFRDVALCHHASSMQSFLVHVPLLKKRLAAVVDDAEECIFIRLDRSLSASRDPPDPLRVVLQEMTSSLAESPDALSFSLSETLTEDILIPLAAVMIDYPAAYVPMDSGQTSFLQGEPLDVYEVSVEGLSTSDFTFKCQYHVLLKFSCPQVLVSKHPELLQDALMEKLKTRFEFRVEKIGMRIHVTHRTEILDRVAL